jgi:chromosome segregation ATPase
LETKLRSELEENVIANEKLSRERSDLKTKCNRVERTANELEVELKTTKSSLDEKSVRVKLLEEKLADMEAEGAKMKGEWAEVERLANEGVSRVRSEMTVTVVENEERHRSQLDALESELQQEREKRRQLEGQVENLIKNAELIVPQEFLQQSSESNQLAKPKRLRQSEGQADILAGALTGLGGEDSDDDDDDEDEDRGGENGNSGSGGSFAALEELTSRLKAARVELNTLRMSYADAEKSRKELAEELGEARNAKEKLPLFETKVSELTTENSQQSLELQALKEDIVEVREMYRTQLNLLVEEKAALAVAAASATESSPIENGTSVVPVEASIQSEEDATNEDVSSE